MEKKRFIWAHGKLAEVWSAEDVELLRLWIRENAGKTVKWNDIDPTLSGLFPNRTGPAIYSKVRQQRIVMGKLDQVRTIIDQVRTIKRRKIDIPEQGDLFTNDGSDGKSEMERFIDAINRFKESLKIPDTSNELERLKKENEELARANEELSEKLGACTTKLKKMRRAMEIFKDI